MSEAKIIMKIPRLFTGDDLEYFPHSRRDIELVGSVWIGKFNGKRVPVRPETVELDHGN